MTPASGRWQGRAGTAWAAALAYGVLAVAYTWPLAARLTTGVPWDLGDALLNDWILAWHYHETGLVLAGAWPDVAWWHPPIFHPAPYAIAYSELLVTEALLGAPIFALTGNLLLTYNVLFIGSFALSALGAFLLVREVTGDARAGWIAGLLYGFALYRVAQATHLQVLHAQWAPLVLYALHRYFAHGRWRAAVGAGLALAAQNLSNGYYLFYLALLLPPYTIVQIVARRRAADWRAWTGPGLAALVAALITVPLMYPYLQLRALGDGVRPLAAVVAYGADTQAWFTASETLRLWGWLRPIVRPEGELFAGLTTMALAAAGAVTIIVRRTGGQAEPMYTRRARGVLAVAAAVSLGWHTVAISLALFAGLSQLAFGPMVVSFGDGRRLLALWACSLVLLLTTSHRARRALRESPDAPVVTLAALVVVTVWLSFGPVLRVGGWPSDSWPAIYGVMHALPGADALRVPPRIAMMTALLMAMLGGIGIAAWRQRRRLPDAVLAGLSVMVIAEAWVAPIPMNLVNDPGPRFVHPPATVAPQPAADPEAAALARLPPDAVIVELPLGSLPHEIRWQYIAAGHWRPRVNGYSGGYPDDYSRVEQVLGSLPSRADEAEALLRARGVTHVVLRPAVWRDASEPAAIGAWLHRLGAVTVRTPAATLEVWELPH